MTRVLLVLVVVTVAGCATVSQAMFPELVQERQRLGAIEFSADRFTGSRSWLLVPMSVSKDLFVPGVTEKAAELRMGALVITRYEGGRGEVASIPATLLFESRSTDWQYLYGEAAVIFLLNGKERLALGRAARDGRVQSGYVVEYMSLDIDLRDVMRIATASTAEGRIGATEFRLLPGHHERLRAFVDSVVTRP